MPVILVPHRFLVLLLAWLVMTACGHSADRRAEHVVVIGIDGCRPEAMQQAAGPVLIAR